MQTWARLRHRCGGSEVWIGGDPTAWVGGVAVVGDQATGIPDAIHSKNILRQLAIARFFWIQNIKVHAKSFRENKTFCVRGGTNDEETPTT